MPPCPAIVLEFQQKFVSCFAKKVERILPGFKLGPVPVTAGFKAHYFSFMPRSSGQARRQKVVTRPFTSESSLAPLIAPCSVFALISRTSCFCLFFIDTTKILTIRLAQYFSALNTSVLEFIFSLPFRLSQARRLPEWRIC